MASSTTKKEEEPEPELVELLTTESHPIEGKTERWRRSDGSVVRVHIIQSERKGAMEVESQA